MNPSELLAHTDFLRRLARSLVRDDGAADDLVQDTRLAVLTSDGQSIDRPRAWLAAIARNVARMTARADVRRRRREALAAMPDASPERTAERIEVQKHVVQAVADLPEPYRTAVMLPYYDGLGPSAIARRLGEKTSAVDTRLRRARGMLRARLDREYGGDRRAWCAALVAGGALVSAKVKTLIAVGVVLVLGFSTWRVLSEPAVPAPDAPQPEASVPRLPDPAEVQVADTRVAVGLVLSRADGSPIPGAGVYAPGEEKPLAVTDERGEWSGAVPPRFRTYVVLAAGYHHGLVQFDGARTGPRSRVRTVFLQPGETRTVSGRVVNAQGETVTDARIRFLRRNVAPTVWQATREGEFGPLTIDPGMDRIEAAAEGYPQTGQDLSEGTLPAAPLEVVLADTAWITGVVVDDLGRPVVGVKVEARLRAHPPPVTTDDTGRFRWPGARGNTTDLGFPKEDHTGRHDELLPGADCRIVLPRGGYLRGRRLWEDGEPAVRCGLSARPVEEPAGGWFEATAQTDEAGLFRLGPLFAGENRIPVFAPLGPQPGTFVEAVGVAEERTDVVLRVPGPSRLVGIVVDATTGEPIPGARISRPAFDDLDRHAVTDAAGRFDAAGPPPALLDYPVKVEVEAPGYRKATRSFPVESAGPLPIEMTRTGRVVLRVVDGEGRPVPGADVSGTPTDSEGRAEVDVPGGEAARLYLRHPLEGTAQVAVEVPPGEELPLGDVPLAPEPLERVAIRLTDEAGEPLDERFLDVPRGGESFSVSLPGREWRTLRYADYPPPGPHTVVLRKTRSVSGHVLDSHGRPLFTAGISTYAGCDGNTLSGTETDGRGAFRIEKVPLVETVLVEAMPPRTSVARVQRLVAPDEDGIEFRLPGTGRLRVTVSAPGEARWPECLILAAGDDDSTWWGEAQHEVVDGVAYECDLPAGRHRVRFRWRPHAWREQGDVLVPESGVVEIEYDDPRPGWLAGRVVDPARRAVSGAAIHILGDDEPRWRTAADGRIEPVLAEEVPTGRVRLVVVADGFAPLVIETVDLGPSPHLDLRLRPGGRLRVTAKEEAWVRVPDLRRIDPATDGETWRGYRRVAAAETLELPYRLPPGEWRVEIRTRGRLPV